MRTRNLVAPPVISSITPYPQSFDPGRQGPRVVDSVGDLGSAWIYLGLGRVAVAEDRMVEAAGIEPASLVF